jgi:hypothetical protein
VGAAERHRRRRAGRDLVRRARSFPLPHPLPADHGRCADRTPDPDRRRGHHRPGRRGVHRPGTQRRVRALHPGVDGHRRPLLGVGHQRPVPGAAGTDIWAAPEHPCGCRHRRVRSHRYHF